MTKRTFYLITLVYLTLIFSLVACGGGEDPGGPDQGEAGGVAQAEEAEAPTGDAVAGREKFASTCSACHGPTGEGVPGLGKDMTASEFIAGKSDKELVEFIKVGRDPSNPLNTTGVAMPPKGGNPAFDEDDLFDVVSYIRTLQK
jgi:disulfide bond formation protein DsbB